MKKTLLLLAAALLFCGCDKPAEELKVISFNIRYNSWDNIDGANAHRRGSDYSHQTISSHLAPLTLHLAPGGGFVAKITTE